MPRKWKVGFYGYAFGIVLRVVAQNRLNGFGRGEGKTTSY